MKSFSISFFSRKTKSKTETKSKIFGRITVDTIRKDFSIGRKVEPTHWNSAKGKPKGKSEPEIELHKYLSTIEEKFFRLERELLEAGEEITPTNLLNAFNGIKTGSEKEITPTLLGAFEQHNQIMLEMKLSGLVVHRTYVRYITTVKFLTLFLQDKYKLKDILLEDVNLSFCEKFDRWLRVNTDCKNNTVVNYIKKLKKIMRYSEKEGWINRNPLTHFKCKIEKIARDFLTMEEINRIRNLQDLPERIHLVRQIFLLGCFTGLSYSDLISLKKHDIQKDNDGQNWIIKPRLKTKIESRIPILNVAKEILDEFAKHPKVINSGLLLPAYSNQKLNAYLKEIASLTRIDKHITFHVSRHSFATTITLANGVSLESVSAQLGHTNLRQTQHYARMVNKRIHSEMKEVNKLFSINVKN